MQDTPINVPSWERALLGTVLAEPDAFAHVQDMRFQDFKSESHQNIWTAIVTTANGSGADLRSVIEQLRINRKLVSVGQEFDDADGVGESYLNFLISRSGDSIERYREMVEQAAVRRSLRSIGAVIMGLAIDENMDVDDALEEAVQNVINVRRGSIYTGATIGELVGMFTGRLDRIIAGDWEPVWAPAVEAVKTIVGFAEETEYITVAARPGEGKSSYLRYEAINAAADGKGVVMFNLENDEIEYGKAMIAMRTGIDSMRLKMGNTLRDQELAAIREASQQLEAMPLHIITMSGPSVGKITSAARHLIATEHIDMMMVDYVQLINNGDQSKVQDITRTTTTLRAFALENKVPIIQAAQMNRGIETRAVNSEPMLSDLRDSGSLEQDSTQVWFPRFVWNEPSDEDISFFPENLDYYNRIRHPYPVVPIRMYVKKNRNGPRGTSNAIKWNRATGVFDTLPEGTL